MCVMMGIGVAYDQFYLFRMSTSDYQQYVGLARTIYIRCIYGTFGREITQYTVIYGVYKRFWPTLAVCHQPSALIITNTLSSQTRSSSQTCSSGQPQQYAISHQRNHHKHTLIRARQHLKRWVCMILTSFLQRALLVAGCCVPVAMLVWLLPD